MNLTKKVALPDMSSVPTPDMRHITDELMEFAGSAADAISSAAGHVPGLDDYRATARRQRLLSIVGVVAIALVLAVIVRRVASGGDDAESTAHAR